MKQENNLGEGSVGRLLFKLAVPTIVAQLVNLLYNLVDRIYIGHIPGTGSLALTGLGICFPIIMIITAFANLIGAGGAPRVAIAMGQDDNKQAEKIVGNCISALVLIAIMLTIFLEICGESILSLFGASGNTMPYAMDYMQIYVIGTLFVMISMGFNPFITTQGFTKEAMKTVIIGAVCNIILDPIFIFVFGMGVRGAALATIVSQAVSAVWVLCFMFGKKTKIKIKKENLWIESKVILPVIALGISPFVMSATESVLNVAFNVSLASYGGDIAVGAMVILASIMQLLTLPVQGLTQGAQPIISFNYGAKKIDRVKQAYKLLIGICVTYTTIFWILIELFPEAFIRIFNNSSPELLATTAWAARIYFATAFLFGLLMSIQQTFMALGQAIISLCIACLRKVVLLIPLILILPQYIEDKVFAVFLAEPVADFLAITIAVILFVTNIKKILLKNAKEDNIVDSKTEM